MAFYLIFHHASHTIIMYTSKPFFLLIFIIVAMSFNRSFAQKGTETDSDVKRKQSLVITLGGGVSKYVSGISAPASLQGDITKTSSCGTIRIMWHPGYRLNLGLQSGFTNFYSYDVKNNVDGKLKLSDVPILVVWSMPIFKNVNIFAGFGSYLLTTDLDYKEAVKSTTFSLGANVALNYTLPLSKNLDLGGEIEWMSAFETKDNLVALKANLIWKAFEWGRHN